MQLITLLENLVFDKNSAGEDLCSVDPDWCCFKWIVPHEYGIDMPNDCSNVKNEWIHGKCAFFTLKIDVYKNS